MNFTFLKSIMHHMSLYGIICLWYDVQMSTFSRSPCTKFLSFCKACLSANVLLVSTLHWPLILVFFGVTTASNLFDFRFPDMMSQTVVTRAFVYRNLLSLSFSTSNQLAPIIFALYKGPRHIFWAQITASSEMILLIYNQKYKKTN